MNQWGGIAGQVPKIPDILELPNGDIVHGGITINEPYDKWILIPWEVEGVEDLPQQQRRKVAKTVIIQRLKDIGKLQEARNVLDTYDLFVREMWNALNEFYVDDDYAIALLSAIGVKPIVIMGEDRETGLGK